MFLRLLTVAGETVILKKLEQSDLADDWATSPRPVPVTARAQLSAPHCAFTMATAEARRIKNFMVLKLLESDMMSVVI